MTEYYSKTLYGKDSKGNLKVWHVEVLDDEVTVSHGRLGGKMASTTTISTPKNVGKSNATTANEQAVVEAEAKVVKQLKKGYYETKEEALEHVERTPMKAQDYKDFKHKVVYPCYLQPKLNGLRMLIDENLKAQSKAGEDYVIPEHILLELRYLKENGLISHGADGEIYAGLESEGGLSLQQIVSAFRKPNENTHKLQYYIYDIPSDSNQFERVDQGLLMEFILEKTNKDLPFYIKVVPTHWIENEEQGDTLFQYYVDKGYEGVVYRNFDGKYEYGKRSYDLLKRKPRLTTEVKVMSVTEDKIGQGVLTGTLYNGRLVEFLMRKDADEVNYRQHENALNLIGKFVEIEYEELSDGGIPTKPVGIRVREVDEKTWEAKE